jgi:glycyl-tRNA synthetase beta chain
LRRQAHGVLRILIDAEALAGIRIRTPLDTLLKQTLAGFTITAPAGYWEHLTEFMSERLQYVFEARKHDRRNVRAVLAARPDVALTVPVADLHENLRALPEFARSEQFRLLASAFKRVRNIARDLSAADVAAIDKAPPHARLTEAAETALVEALNRHEPAIRAVVQAGTGYREAYAEAAKFEPIVARFFNEVFVMAEDAELRRARLWLMKRLEQLILQLGDISEIVATES